MHRRLHSAWLLALALVGCKHVPTEQERRGAELRYEIGLQAQRIRLPNGALYRWQFEKDGETALIDVTGPITLDEPSLARAAALEGIGLGFFMEQDVRADLEARRLVRVLEDWTPPFAGLCLYYPGRRNPSAALRAFISLARELGKRQ